MRLIKCQAFVVAGTKCRVDILAVDRHGVFVLIEVKVRASRFAFNTQLPYYARGFPHQCRTIVAALKKQKFIDLHGSEFWDLSPYFQKDRNGCLTRLLRS